MKYKLINYETIGEGKPVLVIHGWGICSLTMKGAFEPIFSQLKNYKRYYIDLPGMGLSERGDIKNSDGMLFALHDFAVNVIQEKCIVIGQSYGGLLALGLVNKYPELIEKMILLCPCVIPGVQRGRVEPLTVVQKDEELLASLSKEERDSFTQMNVVLTKSVWERYKKFLMPSLAAADWDFLNNVLEGSFSFDVDKMEKPSNIPCLIITAKQDSVVGYKDQFDLLKVYPKATYCAVENAGHNLQIEQPEIFENLVRSWLMTH